MIPDYPAAGHGMSGRGDLPAPLVQVTAGFKPLPVCKDDPLVYDLAYDVRLNTGNRKDTRRGAEEEFKIPAAVEREFTPLLHRHPGGEGEPGGIDGKPAIVHGEEIIKRESQPIGYIHHRRDPGTGERLPLADTRLRFQELPAVLLPTVQGGLRLPEPPGHRDGVTRPRPPPAKPPWHL